MSALKAIQLYIASDVQSALTELASDVYARNTSLYGSVEEVPDWTYKPFGTLWIGGTAASGDVMNRIVYKLGQNLEASNGEVTLLGEAIESIDTPGTYGFSDNEAGAESMILTIVLRQPEQRANWDRIQNAELRLRYLLDESYRKERRRTPPYIPNLGAIGIGGNLRLRWSKIIVPPNAKELWSRYLVCYNTLVPR